MQIKKSSIRSLKHENPNQLYRTYSENSIADAQKEPTKKIDIPRTIFALIGPCVTLFPSFHIFDNCVVPRPICNLFSK